MSKGNGTGKIKVRAYGDGLARARVDSAARRGDLATVLQISEDGVGQLAEAKTVAVERIRPNPAQPRRAFDDGTLRELADSILARGVLQPIRLRRDGDAFQIIAGERRFRAAQLAGLRELPAIVVDQDEDGAYIDSLIENIQREDLNALDRAEALRRLRVNLGLQSWEAVGAVIGVTRQTVHNLLSLDDLPEHLQEDLRAGELTEKHGRALRLLNRRPELQEEAYRRIVEGGFSGDDALALARAMRQPERPASPPAPSPVRGLAIEAERGWSPVLETATEIERLATGLDTVLDTPLPTAARREARAALQRAARRIEAALSRLAG